MRAPFFKLGATPFSSWTNIDKTVANPITGPKTQITAGQLGFFHYFFVTKLGNSSAKWKTFAPVLIIFNSPELLSKYIHNFFYLINFENIISGFWNQHCAVTSNYVSKYAIVTIFEYSKAFEATFGMFSISGTLPGTACYINTFAFSPPLPILLF